MLKEGQEISRDEMRRGLIGLAQQNQELLKLNKKLTQQLETVVEGLNQFKRERQEKAARKETRANRKRLPKRDPMTAEIYKKLIKEAEGPTYLHVRLRLALCFIQFLSFIQEFKALESKDNKVYQITFPAIQFLHFIGGDVKKHYQRNKILKILQSFQTLSPVLEKFSENHFRIKIELLPNKYLLNY